jgi:hypothetical protein
MNKFKFIDIAQNTEEWFIFRAGKLTSSKLGTIMANYPRAFGEPAKKYAVNIALEQINNKPIESDYKNDHMKRGHEQEPIAMAMYEDENFCDVLNGGFFDSKNIGCSPDGLVDDDGVIEIKSVIASVHYANVKRSKFDPAYKWQLIGNLVFTGRDWIDFISFCIDFPRDRQLYTFRIFKEDIQEEKKMLFLRIKQFLQLVKSTKSRILKSSYIIHNRSVK